MFYFSLLADVIILFIYLNLYFQIFKHKEKIQDISTTASNEATLEIMLQKVNLQLILQSLKENLSSHKTLVTLETLGEICKDIQLYFKKL